MHNFPSGIIRCMARPPLFEWEGREYDHVPKGADWYWALGIVAVAGAAASILFADYILAVLILCAALALGLHAAKVPPIHRFQLAEDGLVIGDEFHPYARMESFSVLEDPDDELAPMLSIRTENWLSPHLVIPLENVDAEAIYLHFLERVDEDAHHFNVADLAATWLGF